jgi:nucleoside-diphosphate-sugar epimerase
VAAVLVAGCGYVGAALARELVAAGHAAFGVKRSPHGLPDGVVPVAADLTERDALRAALARPHASFEIAVYAAAADAGDDAAYERAYVTGLRNTLDALRERGDPLRRVFFTSSTRVYAQDDGSWVDEASETAARDFRGARMLEAERLLAASDAPATSLRLGGIYGPGRTRTIESVRSGRAALRAAPHYANRIHRDDAAGALAHAIAASLRGDDVPEILIGVDDDPADEADVLRWIAARLGVPEPPVRGAPGPPTGKRCSNARLRATGYRLRFPTFREGYAAALTRP